MVISEELGILVIDPDPKGFLLIKDFSKNEDISEALE